MCAAYIYFKHLSFNNILEKCRIPLENFLHVFFGVPSRRKITFGPIRLRQSPRLVLHEAILQGDAKPPWEAGEGAGLLAATPIQQLILGFDSGDWGDTTFAGLVKPTSFQLTSHFQVISCLPLVMQPLWHLQFASFLQLT